MALFGNYPFTVAKEPISLSLDKLNEAYEQLNNMYSNNMRVVDRFRGVDIRCDGNIFVACIEDRMYTARSYHEIREYINTHLEKEERKRMRFGMDWGFMSYPIHLYDDTEERERKAKEKKEAEERKRKEDEENKKLQDLISYYYTKKV